MQACTHLLAMQACAHPLAMQACTNLCSPCKHARHSPSLPISFLAGQVLDLELMTYLPYCLPEPAL